MACNCKERIRKEMMEHNLYPGAERIDLLDIELFSGRTFTRAEAVYPHDPTKKKQQKPKSFNLFHQFCPHCGAPYEEEDETYLAVKEGYVKVPPAILKTMEKKDVVLVEPNKGAEDTALVMQVIFDCYDSDEEEGYGAFVFQSGDDTEAFRVADYDQNYYVMMKRQDYWDHIVGVIFPEQRSKAKL